MMSGRISQAVAMVNQLYPNLLDNNKELLFRVLCRQFVETIAGYDQLTPPKGEQDEMSNEDGHMDTDNNVDHMTTIGNCKSYITCITSS